MHWQADAAGGAEPIDAKLAEWSFSRKAETAKFHQLERWRDRLLADESVVGELLEQYPELDVQHVRNLIRNARQQQARNQPKKQPRAVSIPQTTDVELIQIPLF
ncbi:MAG: ribosome biogenesis factor YjgA [Thiolinea sp.]